MKQSIVRRLVWMILAAVMALSMLGSSKLSAGTLNTSVIGMFPKDMGEFAYADMKAARQFPWFPQLREQILPANFRQFEQFLSSAGVDPNTQVDEIAWGGIAASKGSGEDIVGVALGSFDPSSIEARFKQQKLPMIDLHGYHLYAFGSGSGASDILFVFLDSNTAAFGHRPALEKLIGVRMGDSESLLSNDKFFPLISEANGTGFIWAVLNQTYTHLAMQELLPQANQFPQAAAIVNRLQAMTISIKGDNGIDARFQAVCNSPDDANLLGAAMQAGLMYRRFQESKTDPALASALDSVQVSPSGDRLRIDMTVTQDQLTALINSHVFAAQI